MFQEPLATSTQAHNDNIVTVLHLNKSFKDFWLRTRVKAVEDVSFDIHRGEVFGLLGPNGSGKSTSIKILLGLLYPSSGIVKVFGKPPSDVAVKKRIGYLPEESYLYPFLNARETLDYYAKLFELDRSVRERRIDELLDMVGLTAVQFRPVREYSKGMQRRIGIAQALINDPELLILDEPTTGLDPIGTRQIKDLILSLARRGKTVLLSSHLLADVEDCVDRMIILYGGKIQAEGTCDQLLESAERAIIETDALDDQTISQIDQIIRQRTAGRSAINRVSRPRQRLEDFFVELVEKARDAKIATAGAQHGGHTAAFLTDGSDQPARLIADLVASNDHAPADQSLPAQSSPSQARRTGTAAASTLPPKAGPDQSVLGNLLKTGSPPGAPAPGDQRGPASPAPIPAATLESVDRSLIGSLLDQTQSGKASNDDSKVTPKGSAGGPGPGGRTP